VTDPHPAWSAQASIHHSNSSIQSSVASLACSGPNNSVTALMKSPNSCSAMTIRSASAGLCGFSIITGSVDAHSSLRFLKPKAGASCDLTVAIKPEKWRKPIGRVVGRCFL